MAKNAKNHDLSRLAPFDPDDKSLLQVIIETPRGSRNKFAYDPRQNVFEVKAVLPSGMTFPYEFGFVPSTKADDGDPIDVLVLMDEPATPGCLAKCRLVGAIEGEQIDKQKGKKVRNDRLLGIERSNHEFADVKDIKDLDKKLLEELEKFFVNYHDMEGKKYKVLGLVGAKNALKLLKKTMRRLTWPNWKTGSRTR